MVETNKKSQVKSAEFHGPSVPSYNHALVLGWDGLVDTNLDFSEFFDQDHTIMVRFMPRYPYAYAGPFLAENGQGTYFIGQGDYRWGNGGFLTKGDPVLFIKIGNSFRTYLMPEVQRATWHHLAVVRTGNTFTIYVDGQMLSPTLNISSVDLPQGNLRLGRRTEQRMIYRTHSLDGAGYVGQFYGLIDDVAVYKRPLSESEIRDLNAGVFKNGRLTGHESDLYAGWCFDVPGMNFEPRILPPQLARSYSMTQPNSSLVQVSAVSRSDPMDGIAMDSYHVQWNLTLPFKSDEPWKVIQGYDSQGGSHNGFASFCWDFVRSDLASSEGVILVSSAPGRADMVIEGYPQSSPNGNEVNFKIAEGVYYGFLHIQQGSFSRFGFDPTPPQNDPEWLRPFVNRDIEVAAVGDTGSPGNPHLHFGTSPVVSGSSGLITMPIAFSNYWVLEGNAWVFVALGTPTSGQVIMKRGGQIHLQSNLTSWIVPNGEEHVVGLGSDGTLHEFYFIPSVGKWQHNNISQITGVTLAAISNLTSWIVPNGEEHVVGLGSDGTLHEFYFIPSVGKWQHNNISQITGVTLAAISNLTSWIVPNGEEHVVGLGSDGTLHEFYFIPSVGKWQHNNISQITGVTLAAISNLTSWIVPNGEEHVVGLGSDGTLHEFYFIPSVGKWQHGTIN